MLISKKESWLAKLMSCSCKRDAQWYPKLHVQLQLQRAAYASLWLPKSSQFFFLSSMNHKYSVWFVPYLQHICSSGFFKNLSEFRSGRSQIQISIEFTSANWGQWGWSSPTKVILGHLGANILMSCHLAHLNLLLGQGSYMSILRRKSKTKSLESTFQWDRHPLWQQASQSWQTISERDIQYENWLNSFECSRLPTQQHELIRKSVSLLHFRVNTCDQILSMNHRAVVCWWCHVSFETYSGVSVHCKLNSSNLHEMGYVAARAAH